LVLGYQGKKIQLADKPVFNRLDKDQWELGNGNIRFSPVFHVLDPKVKEKSGYQKQIIFEVPGQ